MLIPVPPSECLLAREAASRRLDQELSELESSRLDAHLRHCAPCQEFVDQTAAITLHLRRSPLESMEAPIFESRRRRRPSTVRLQAAAAVLAVVAAGSSFALGRMVAKGSGTPGLTASATAVDLGSAREDSIEQRLLALLPPFHRPGTPSSGSAVAL